MYFFFAFQTRNKAKHKAFPINSQKVTSSWMGLDLIKGGYHTPSAYSPYLAHTLNAKNMCVCLTSAETRLLTCISCKYYYPPYSILMMSFSPYFFH